MKTSVIGYPRIGEKRELKRATEKYLKGELSKEELFEEGKKIREKQWNLQNKIGIDYISSNDFSFYDGFLDTIIMLNAIPEKYKSLELDDIDLYFAMAKGYQKNNSDVQALPMKKWFNTNYHYLVPIITKEKDFKLNCKKILAEYNEAKKNGIQTKPVIIGPLTFLKLSIVKIEDFAYLLDKIILIYKELIIELKENGVEYIQIDEPILVTDLVDNDINNFNKIYKNLLTSTSAKIILQTYFGDVRDIYKEIIKLPFYGIGLDFIEGEQNLSLIKSNNFPVDMVLFAGVINGKNIWKNDYSKTKSIIDSLKKHIDEERIVLNTSCSLLHVPYTLKYETKLGHYKNYLSFAEEKLVELSELKKVNNDDFTNSKEYIKNQEIINSKNFLKEFYNNKITERVKSLNNLDFNRDKSFKERNIEQKECLNLPLFPTTTIGSFPQTKEVRKIRRDYKNGVITKEVYESKIRENIKSVIKLQEKIDLDVLVHGEYERNDMVEYFGENLSGFLFTENGWVQSYGTRGVKPPIIFGDVERKQDFTVKWIEYAQSLTDKPVKGMLTGPITIQNWSFLREDLSLQNIAFQIGLAIQDEVNALENAGIKIIQIDEAALREKLPIRKEEWESYLDWAIRAFRLTNSKVSSKTQIHTHMCYSEFGNIIEAIKELDADVLTVEAAKSNLDLLASIKENGYDKELGPGIYDIHSPRIPSVVELSSIFEQFINILDKDKLWINPDCGLKTRGDYETVESLKNLVKTSRNMRAKYCFKM